MLSDRIVTSEPNIFISRSFKVSLLKEGAVQPANLNGSPRPDLRLIPSRDKNSETVIFSSIYYDPTLSQIDLVANYFPSSHGVMSWK
jgi:hypothetical protein